jgi:hypothetical protein
MRASLLKMASPAHYSMVNQVITYTYQIRNTGSLPLCQAVIINDDKLGAWCTPAAYIAPGDTFNVVRNYRVTAEDITNGSITNSAVAYVKATRDKWLITDYSDVTVTYGYADLYGSISQVYQQAQPLSADITNSGTTGTTPSKNVSLVLDWPAGVISVNDLIAPPGSLIILEPTNSITIGIPVIDPGQEFVFHYRYFVANSGFYRWSGIIRADTYDPNVDNNTLSINGFIP